MSSTTNTAISSDSRTRKHIRKYLSECLMLSQLDRIQIGVMNVVSSTKYRLIPSIPMCRWQKVTWSEKNSCVNWYWLVPESNSPHSTIDTTKFSREVPSAIRFIVDAECSFILLIGDSMKAPIRGIIRSSPSINK